MIGPVVRIATPDEHKDWPSVPPGHVLVWTIDPKWRPLTGVERVTRACRFPACDRPPEMAVQRIHGEGHRWWRYCPDHAYGRILENGQVLGRCVAPI